MLIKTRTWKTAVAVASLAGICGCGSNDTIDVEDVNEDVIYQSIDLEYDAQEKQAEISVQLRAGGRSGTTVAVQDEQALLVNNKPMSESDGRLKTINLTGTSYGLTGKKVAKNDSFRLIWNRKDGKQIQTDIRIAPEYSYATSYEGVSVSKSGHYDFAMKMAEDESPRSGISTYSYRCDLKSNLEDIPDGFDAFITTSSREPDCKFTMDELSKLPNGKATLSPSLVVTSSEGPANMKGRSIRRAFIAVPRTIQIVE